MPMKLTPRRCKCLHCSHLFAPDPRNRGRQKYCSAPACRQASKQASQRRWARQPANRDYFRGPDHVRRVQQWRREHPGYWRRPPRPGRTLQESCPAQVVAVQGVVAAPLPEPSGPALQDLCRSQPALLVGIISMMTGHGLQEDIAASARSFLTRGEDILRMVRRGPQNPRDENQTRPVPAEAAACASSI